MAGPSIIDYNILSTSRFRTDFTRYSARQQKFFSEVALESAPEYIRHQIMHFFSSIFFFPFPWSKLHFCVCVCVGVGVYFMSVCLLISVLIEGPFCGRS
jgi:hypothetical protein